MKEATPQLFKEHLIKTLDSGKSYKEKDHKIIILRSWNEWAEGNYVEPDLKYGHGYLNVIKEMIIDDDK